MWGFLKNKHRVSNTDSEFSDVGLSKEKVEKIDMDNIIQSMFHAERLYNILKTKCHPDRFVGDDLLINKADKIFKDIAENKRNFKKLQELKIQAQNELNIIL